jgi:thioester reductase-like protein
MKKAEETFICFHGDLCAIIHAENEEKARKRFQKSLKEYKKNEIKVVS